MDVLGLVASLYKGRGGEQVDAYEASLHDSHPVFDIICSEADLFHSRVVVHVVRPNMELEGYAKLSSWMTTDREIAIYRKFGALNAQNLLHYQAELVGLETELQEIASEDRRSQDSSKQLYADNWFELSNAEPGKDRQLRKVLEIRKVLKEYSVVL